MALEKMLNGSGTSQFPPFQRVLAAFGAGTARPLMTVIWGDLVNLYNDVKEDTDTSYMKHTVDKKALMLLIIFIAQWTLVWTYGSLFSIAAMHHSIRLRASYLKAIVCKDTEEVHESKAATDLSTNISVIEEALSEKLGTVMQAISTVVSSLVIAFIKSWRLTLVLSGAILFLIFKDLGTSALDTKLERQLQAIDSQASALAQECFTGIRTINACCAEDKVVDRYTKILDHSKMKGLQKSRVPAIQYSVTVFVMLAAYALAFWYGTNLLVHGQIKSGGSILIVILCMNQATNALRLLVPIYGILARATAARESLSSILKSRSRLDPFSDFGEPLDAMYSRVEFQDVHFSYPSRRSVKVFNGLNLTFGAGKTTAIVGPSGSGKSTIVGLLERWYDCNSGHIKINGSNIDSYNLRSLRSNIRVVQQDAVLFNDTIFNNVSHGLIGSPYHDLSENEKRRLVVKVCKDIQAHEFIMQFPQAYDTVVGVRGSLLSGGQRQRIAIARAIISNPVILIFDEATSALDADSERVVQATIERVSRGRTSIIIAHKLATIKRADRIVLFKDGVVAEEGTHYSLLRTSNDYARIWRAQTLTQKETYQREFQKSDNSETSPERSTLSDTKSDALGGDVFVEVQTPETAIDMGHEHILSFPQTAKMIIGGNRIMVITYFLSFLSCLVAGSIYPGQAIFFAQAVTSWQKLGVYMVQDANFWSLMWFGLALVGLVGFFAVGSLSSIGGTLTARVYRGIYFRGLLLQPVTFFDSVLHSPSSLVAHLSSDPANLQGFAILFSSLAITVVNLGSFVILGLVVSWRFTLVALVGTFPVIVFAGFLRVRSQQKKNKTLSEPLMSSAQYAAEVIENIRTVSAFAMESEVCQKMAQKMTSSMGVFYRNLLFTMPMFALSQSGNLLGMTLSFWYSGHLLADRKIGALEIWIVFLSVVSGSDAAGEFFGSTSSIVHARSSGGRIKSVMADVEKTPPSARDDAEKPFLNSLSFTGVSFSYPNTRQPILNNINIEIPQGLTVAVVGPSGSGKSTIISLLERFYEPSLGQICIGGIPLAAICKKSYRSKVSLVSQETQLFNCTVRENILLGFPEDQVADEALIQAARDANIHDFIMSLPEGYNTACGKKGMEFSGGQRQRLAIARALVRNPSILLLDEATSALDSESEREVKEALSKAAQGRTTLVIAHRLSTIQDADRIFVLSEGSIVEEGSHVELMALRGVYWSLCQKQNLD
ncbi:ABC transporter-like protein [Lojkania enalia]|uniref:ABC transporter-like protein n=1 Tax=Lojkania enalia TaxID=147567 RepID=A0A9P4N7P0_9PLEO|nr:ABC transporter-like protein [Didymosphaeria enalia]